MTQTAGFKGLPQTISPIPFPTSFFSLPTSTWRESAQSFISSLEEEVEAHQSRKGEAGQPACSQPWLGREEVAAKGSDSHFGWTPAVLNSDRL